MYVRQLRGHLLLLNEHFRYWYEGEEIDRLSRLNEVHRMKDPVEENIFIYFRKALPEDVNIKWIPAAVILSKIAIYGKIQANHQSMQALVQALEKYEFKTRINNEGTTEYEVVDLQQAEIEENFNR